MLTEYILVVLFCLITGYIGGYAGIGGGVVLIFLFTTFLNYPQHMAQGTIMAIMLGPLTITGVMVMKKRIKPLLVYALIGIITYPVFSWLGAVLAYSFPSRQLRLIFAVFLVVLGLYNFFYFLLKKEAAEKKPLLTLNYFYMVLASILMGFVGGLLGIGAGVLLVPLLTWLFGMEKDDARTLSFMVLLPPVNLAAVLNYYTRGDVFWPVVIPGFLCLMFSNYWGARMGKKHENRIFQLGLSGILCVLGCINIVLSLRQIS